MKRGIEFRGLRTDGKGWIYGSLIDFGSFFAIWNKEGDLLDYIQQDRRISPEYVVLKESVGQYTGLKDKNGTKIFEGDKLVFKNEALKDFTISDVGIYYYDGAFCITILYDLHSVPICQDDCDSSEIIGNIHE